MPVGKPIYITKIGIILCAQSTCHAAYVIIKYCFLRCRCKAHDKFEKSTFSVIYMYIFHGENMKPKSYGQEWK